MCVFVSLVLKTWSCLQDAMVGTADRDYYCVKVGCYKMPGFLHCRFQQCCERAFAASLLLVSRCTGEKPDKLEEMYRKCCGDDVFKLSADMEADEVMPEEELEQDPGKDQQEPPPPQQACEKFLLDFAGHNDATLVFNQNLEEPQPQPESELDGLPDQETLERLMEEKNPEEQFGHECARSPKLSKKGNALPSSLREAMAMPGCMFNSLMRLSVRLRSAKGGCDVQFLPNAKNCRRASQKLNWFQCLGWIGCGHLKAGCGWMWWVFAGIDGFRWF